MKLLSLSIAVVLTTLIGCSTGTLVADRFGSEPSNFESSPMVGDSRLVLQCSGVNTSAISCHFSQKGGKRPDNSQIKLELLPLTSDRMYLKRLISDASKEVLETPNAKRDMPVSENDLVLLQDFLVNQDSCIADTEHADLLVLCPVARKSSDTVVMFVRGLCDKCQFQPVILRKIKK